MRFSKAKLLAYISTRQIELIEQFGFDSENGTAQLLPGDSLDRVMAYGEYDGLSRLMDALEVR